LEPAFQPEQSEELERLEQIAAEGLVKTIDIAPGRDPVGSI